MKMKELPLMERPYEKLENNGAASLSTAELLAIIIKTGTKNKTALDISQELLKEDTNERGISFLHQLSLQELMQKDGIGRVKAIELKAVAELSSRAMIPTKKKAMTLSCAREVYELLKSSYYGESQEIIKTILLNCHNKIIKIANVATGSVNMVIITPKEVFAEAIKTGATSIVLVHNHPSGDARPSREDIEFTNKIKKASEAIGITLLDHIIIAEEEYASFRELKKL